MDLLVNNIMLPFLNFSYKIIPNYGVAIILLTLIVKILFQPLTKKQFEAMKKNQELQPMLKEIQAKFKDSPEKLQKEMLKFWKEHKMNPLSGCLPAIIQFPVFIAIFMTINSKSFQAILTQPGINPGFLPFWCSNLAKPDSLFLLPIIIGLATYWSQKSMKIDPQQAAIFMFMPFLMVIISWKMASGVLLYWAVSTIISTIQQIWVLRKADSDQGLTTELVQNK